MFEVMFFGFGLLFASLFGLVILPLVHNRAVRLTMKHLEASAPVSMAEIQADKDQLRAEFAMSTRRLELTVEQMKARSTGWVAELGKKTDAINRLKAELREKTATMLSLQARQKALTDQLSAIESELRAKAAALREAERMLEENQAELIKLAADLNEGAATHHSEQWKLHRCAWKCRLSKTASLVMNGMHTNSVIGWPATQGGGCCERRSCRRSVGKAEKLSDRVSQLERQLVAQTTEAEVLRRRIQEVTAQDCHPAKYAAQAEVEIAQLRDKIIEIQQD